MASSKYERQHQPGRFHGSREIERIQKTIDQLVVGGGGLDRQDRLLAQWDVEAMSGIDEGHGDFALDGQVTGKPANIEIDDESAHGRRDRPEARPSELERISTGCNAIDADIGGGLIRHGMHEWLGDPFAVQRECPSEHPGDDPEDLLAGHWVPCLGPVIGILHRLRNAHDALGRSAPNIAWIGRRCLPGPWNLVSRCTATTAVMADNQMAGHGHGGMSNAFQNMPCGVDARLLDRSVFVLPEEDDRAARRWCLEAAIRTPALDAVIVDGSAFDALDSRRVQLGLLERRRRGESALLVMVVRPPKDVRLRSSASTRWLIEPSPATGPASPDDIRPIRDSRRWRLRLVRCRMPQAAPTRGECLEGIVSDDWPTGEAVRCSVVEGRDRSTLDSSIEKEHDVSKIRLDQTAEPAHGSRETATPTAVGKKFGGLFPEFDSWPARGSERWNPRTRGRRRRTRPGGRPAEQRPTGDRLLFTVGTPGRSSNDDARGGAGDHGLEPVGRIPSDSDAAVAIDASP